MKALSPLTTLKYVAPIALTLPYFAGELIDLNRKKAFEIILSLTASGDTPMEKLANTYCENEPYYLSYPEEATFLTRLEEQVSIVREDIAARGISTVEQFNPANTFHCERVIYDACDNGWPGLKVINLYDQAFIMISYGKGTSFDNWREVSNAVLRHEGAHIGHSYYGPPWLKEAVADKLAERKKAEKDNYYLPMKWFDFLARKIEERGIDESGEDFLIRQTYTDREDVLINAEFFMDTLSEFDLPQEEKEKIVHALSSGSVESLWKSTADFLNELTGTESDIGVTKEQVERVMKADACVGENADQEARIDQSRIDDRYLACAGVILFLIVLLDERRKKRSKNLTQS